MFVLGVVTWPSLSLGALAASVPFTVSVCPRAGQETLSGVHYYRNAAVVRSSFLTSRKAALFILLFSV